MFQKSILVVAFLLSLFIITNVSANTGDAREEYQAFDNFLDACLQQIDDQLNTVDIATGTVGQTVLITPVITSNGRGKAHQSPFGLVLQQAIHLKMAAMSGRTMIDRVAVDRIMAEKNLAASDLLPESFDNSKIEYNVKVAAKEMLEKSDRVVLGQMQVTDSHIGFSVSIIYRVDIQGVTFDMIDGRHIGSGGGGIFTRYLWMPQEYISLAADQIKSDITVSNAANQLGKAFMAGWQSGEGKIGKLFSRSASSVVSAGGIIEDRYGRVSRNHYIINLAKLLKHPAPATILDWDILGIRKINETALQFAIQLSEHKEVSAIYFQASLEKDEWKIVYIEIAYKGKE